jgi:hypothetical protein
MQNADDSKDTAERRRRLLSDGAQVTIPSYFVMFPDPINPETEIEEHMNITAEQESVVTGYADDADITQDQPSYMTIDSDVFHVPQDNVASVISYLQLGD